MSRRMRQAASTKPFWSSEVNGRHMPTIVSSRKRGGMLDDEIRITSFENERVRDVCCRID